MSEDQKNQQPTGSEGELPDEALEGVSGGAGERKPGTKSFSFGVERDIQGKDGKPSDKTAWINDGGDTNI